MLRSTALNIFRCSFHCRPSHITASLRVYPGLAPTQRTFTSTNQISAVHNVQSHDSDIKRPPKRHWQLTYKHFLIGVGMAGVAYYVSHLEQVPETGRWRFMNISQNLEETISKQLRETLLEKYGQQRIPSNHVISRHVRRVVTQILTASDLGYVRGEVSSSPDFLASAQALFDGEVAPWDADSQRNKSRVGDYTSEISPEREWEVIVVKAPDIVNATVVPGLIIVFTGILPICKDERGLAAVLAHEVGHVVARHTAERISSQSISLTLLTVLEFFGYIPPGLDYLADFLHLPNSKRHEYEADKIGLALMSRACYDPHAAVEMFDRLHRLESTDSRSIFNIDFFKTHPENKKRVEELEKLLPKAYEMLHANSDCAVIQDRLRSFREVGIAVGRLGGVR